MVAYQDWREVHRLADEAARAAGDARGQAALLVALGWVVSERTPPGELSQVFAAASASFERLGDLPGTAEALIGQGSCLRLTSRLEQALACFERARAIAVQTGAPDQEAAAAFGIAMIDRERGRFDRGLEQLELNLPVWRDRGALRWEALTVRIISLVLRDQGDLLGAEARLEQALALAGELDDRQQQLLLLVDRGELHCRLGQPDAARAALELALRRARDLGLVYDQARALHALGDLHAAEAELGDALRCLTESVRLWRLVGIPRRLARTLDRLGSVHDEAGEPGPAAGARQEAGRLLAAMDSAAAEAVGRIDRLAEG
jgi:tetratricopeptide (TPR) repeat protein